MLLDIVKYIKLAFVKNKNSCDINKINLFNAKMNICGIMCLKVFWCTRYWQYDFWYFNGTEYRVNLQGSKSKWFFVEVSMN